MPRPEFLSYLKVGELYYDTAEHEDTLVRVYGTTGVVTGRSNLAYRFKGKAGFERLRYTAVYAGTDGQWRLVAWHSTERPEQREAYVRLVGALADPPRERRKRMRLAEKPLRRTFKKPSGASWLAGQLG